MAAALELRDGPASVRVVPVALLGSISLPTNRRGSVHMVAVAVPVATVLVLRTARPALRRRRLAPEARQSLVYVEQLTGCHVVKDDPLHLLPFGADRQRNNALVKAFFLESLEEPPPYAA